MKSIMNKWARGDSNSRPLPRKGNVITPRPRARYMKESLGFFKSIVTSHIFRKVEKARHIVCQCWEMK